MLGSDIQFPRVELLRAEATLLKLYEVPDIILKNITKIAEQVSKTLRKFVEDNEDLASICSFGELEQNYMGTCDERTLISNYVSLNYTSKFKNQLIKYCLPQFQPLVGQNQQYALISSNQAKQYETHYLIYENEDFVDRLSSYGMMAFFAMIQNINQVYDEELFIKLKPGAVVETIDLPKTPKPVPVGQTKNFLKDFELQMQDMMVQKQNKGYEAEQKQQNDQQEIQLTNENQISNTGYTQQQYQQNYIKKDSSNSQINLKQKAKQIRQSLNNYKGQQQDNINEILQIERSDSTKSLKNIKNLKIDINENNVTNQQTQYTGDDNQNFDQLQTQYNKVYENYMVNSGNSDQLVQKINQSFPVFDKNKFNCKIDLQQLALKNQKLENIVQDFENEKQQSGLMKQVLVDNQQLKLTQQQRKLLQAQKINNIKNSQTSELNIDDNDDQVSQYNQSQFRNKEQQLTQEKNIVQLEQNIEQIQTQCETEQNKFIQQIQQLNLEINRLKQKLIQQQADFNYQTIQLKQQHNEYTQELKLQFEEEQKVQKMQLNKFKQQNNELQFKAQYNQNLFDKITSPEPRTKNQTNSFLDQNQLTHGELMSNSSKQYNLHFMSNSQNSQNDMQVSQLNDQQKQQTIQLHNQLEQQFKKYQILEQENRDLKEQNIQLQQNSLQQLNTLSLDTNQNYQNQNQQQYKKQIQQLEQELAISEMKYQSILTDDKLQLIQYIDKQKQQIIQLQDQINIKQGSIQNQQVSNKQLQNNQKQQIIIQKQHSIISQMKDQLQRQDSVIQQQNVQLSNKYLHENQQVQQLLKYQNDLEQKISNQENELKSKNLKLYGLEYKLQQKQSLLEKEKVNQIRQIYQQTSTSPVKQINSVEKLKQEIQQLSIQEHNEKAVIDKKKQELQMIFQKQQLFDEEEKHNIQFDSNHHESNNNQTNQQIITQQQENDIQQNNQEQDDWYQ